MIFNEIKKMLYRKTERLPHQQNFLQSQVQNFGLVRKVLAQNFCPQSFYRIKISLYLCISKYYITCENKEYTAIMI